jgi:N-acetylneuraminic acid mutarotase
MKIITLILSLFTYIHYSYAQTIGIGTSVPNTSGILDLTSVTQGFLIPRMTLAQRDAIVNPKKGLQIFNLTSNCVDTYTGSSWNKDCIPKNLTSVIPQGSWTAKSNFGGMARYKAVGFSIGNKGYVGAGFSRIGGNIKDFWEYDASTNIWTQKADLGVWPRYDASSFVIGSFGYVCGGYTPIGPTNELWQYNPSTNTWLRKTDFPGGDRYEGVGFAVGSFGYFGTGRLAGLIYNDIWQYNPTSNTWLQMADFPGAARLSPVAFSIGTKAYLGTGLSSIFEKDFYEYNPSINTWTQKSNFGGVGRWNACGFSIGTKGYIGTGQSGQTLLNDFWEYDPSLNNWVQKSNVGLVNRMNAVGFSIGTNGYISTGDLAGDKEHKRDLWRYNTLPSVLQKNIDLSPSDGLMTHDHDWVSENNTLSTVQENIEVSINGSLNVQDTTRFGKLFTATRGIKTKYSASVAKTVVAGLQFINITIPMLPSGWDFTNTLVLVSVADATGGTIHQAKLTSPINIQVKFNAQGAGQTLFQYIIFKL